MTAGAQSTLKIRFSSPRRALGDFQITIFIEKSLLSTGYPSIRKKAFAGAVFSCKRVLPKKEKPYLLCQSGISLASS